MARSIEMVEIFKQIGKLLRKKGPQDIPAISSPELPAIPDHNLPFDERWDKAEFLQAEARRRFLESEVQSIISKSVSGQESELPEFNFVHLALDPSELERSQLPDEVRDYLLDHFHDPDINRYRRIQANGRQIQLWGDPKIAILLENSRVTLKTRREVPNATFLGGPAFWGRAVYLGIPSVETGYSLAVGIKSDFQPYMQRRVDSQMTEYISTNKWLVAKELARFAEDVVNSRSQLPT